VDLKKFVNSLASPSVDNLNRRLNRSALLLRGFMRPIKIYEHE